MPVAIGGAVAGVAVTLAVIGWATAAGGLVAAGIAVVGLVAVPVGCITGFVAAAFGG